MASYTLNSAHVRQYERDLHMLTQREGALLRPFVDSRMVNGKSLDIPRLAKIEATIKSGVHVDTPQTYGTHTNRRLTLNTYHQAVRIDKDDDIKMLIDPRSEYTQNLVRGLGRKQDDLIIAALEGNAVDVDADGTTSNVALTHTIDEDFGTGSDSDITLEKVIEAYRILLDNDVPDQERRILVLDPTAYANYIQENNVASFDFNASKPQTSGNLPMHMGFIIVKHTGLSTTSESFKRCLAFTDKAITYGEGDPISVKIGERADKSYDWQAYARMSGGAVRRDEDRVVAIEAYRT